jgi:fructose-1,6-bisphosphatase/inositol monophosphatase family enzyme
LVSGVFDTSWLPLLEEIATAVHTEIRSKIDSIDPAEFVCMGKDGTATKLIDKLAEDVILEKVKDQPMNILSEEAGYIDKGAEHTLVIDPIDGTNNSAWGLPLYSVSLAVGNEKVSDVEAGIVKNLATGDTFKAEKGSGAFYKDHPIKVRPYKEESSVFCAYLGKKAPDFCYEILKVPGKARYLGSTALEMCYVAKGDFDLFIQSGQNIRVIDVAASCLILKEAGGKIYDGDLNEFDMNFDIDQRKTVIAVGDDAVLDVVRRFL